MWTCTYAYNPASAQSGVLAALFADLRAEQHADNSALRHIANAHMTARQQVRLHACPHSQLSYNPTPQQEGMRT